MTPKFKPGELAIAISRSGRRHECRLIRIIGKGRYIPEKIQPGSGPVWEIDVPSHLSSHSSGHHAMHESNLRKRPGPEDFKKSLTKCDKQFPAQLDRWLNPAPAPADMEARIARIFPSLDELSKRNQVYEELFRVGRNRYTPNWLRDGFDE